MCDCCSAPATDQRNFDVIGWRLMQVQVQAQVGDTRRVLRGNQLHVRREFEPFLACLHHSCALLVKLGLSDIKSKLYRIAASM